MTEPKLSEHTLGQIANQFAIDVQREINLRNGCFIAHTEREKHWQKVGAVSVKHLDTVKEYCE